MGQGNTNFGNSAGTGTVGADGFIGPLTGNVTGSVSGNVSGGGAFGNVTAGNISVTGAISTLTLAASGNLSAGNISVSGGGLTVVSLPASNPHVAGQFYTGNVSGNITVLVSQG